MALNHFSDNDFKVWDWWWDWMDIAIEFADSPERQNRILKVLDSIMPNDDDWCAMHHVQTAQEYKLKLISMRGTAEEQCAFAVYLHPRKDVEKIFGLSS